MAHLLDVSSNKAIFLTNKTFTIGRALNNCLVAEDLPISRVHCVLQENEDGFWTLTDRSSNGTLLNKTLVKGKTVTLHNDDMIEVSENFRYLFKQVAAKIDVTFDAVAEVVCDEDIIKEFSASPTREVVIEDDNEPLPLPPPPPNEAQPGPSNVPDEDLGEEMQCSICTEYFVNATTVNCSHTFCKYCIEEWTKKNNYCPICRAKVTSKVSTRVIDNCIDKFLRGASEDEKTRREQLVKERTEAVKPKKQKKNESVLVVSSDSDDDMDEVEEEEEDDYPDYQGDYWPFDHIYEWDDDTEDDIEYNGIPGAYYGGYGQCFKCGSRGHWANGCPF